MDYIRGMSPRPPSRDAERLFRGQFLLLGLLVLAIGGIVWLILAPSGSGGGPVGPLHDVGAEPRPVQASMGATSDEERTITAFNLARRSVVGISTGGLAAVRRNGHRVPIQIPKGTGSGFVWDAGGWIVTNWHVVKEGSLVRVTLAGGKLREGVLVGASAQDDLAVIKIDPTGLDLVPLAVGTSHDLRIGQSVLAIGNPFGLDGSLSKGVISGLNRLIETDQKLRMEGGHSDRCGDQPGELRGCPAGHQWKADWHQHCDPLPNQPEQRRWLRGARGPDQQGRAPDHCRGNAGGYGACRVGHFDVG